MTVENKANGEVVLTTPGGVPRLLARVKQPLKGIGRYAGTERAGNGCVLSWSPTTVLVSTAGTLRRASGDQPEEDRGGFVLQPAEPALRGTTHPASQLLLEAVGEGPGRPVVSTFFGLPGLLSTSEVHGSEPHPGRGEDQIGSWEPFPDLRGTVEEGALPRALQQALGGRAVKQGITHLRFVFGSAPASLERRIRLATTPLTEGVQRGNVKITANVMGEGVASCSSFSTAA